MKDVQVLAELSKTDAYADGTSMPDAAWSHETALLEIERRMGMKPKERIQNVTFDQVDPAPEVDSKIEAGISMRRFRPKSRLGVAVAALMVVVLGIGSWAVLRSSEAEEVGIVLAAINARNDLDFEAWAAHFTPELFDRTDVQAARILMAANERAEVVEPCRVVETAADGASTVECGIVYTNDFHGPAGLSITAPERFVVDADGVIQDVVGVASAHCCREQAVFNLRFWTWMNENYPDVSNEIRPIDILGIPGWRNVDHMPAAIQYVDEFIAQDPDYPVDRG